MLILAMIHYFAEKRGVGGGERHGQEEPESGDVTLCAHILNLHQTGLPIDTNRAPRLCELEPFLSANELLVTPIVAFIIDPLIKVS
jgi:coenzyme A diphosphatase NUDT7